ncbi:hypothetical protein [Frankia sp. AgB32]|uniref:hypothetical protein n=1 Tax=Frankia sp. AgB32 TaxID=631119 RepID=UPI00200E8D9D|nr:hypothetical protein [Frankia sp. AgB32]MCK9893636.1 hypothetical protein [Frankia sp. AgB32]
MNIREKLASRAQPYLQPGEEIRQVFPAQTLSQYLVALMPILYYTGIHRIVVVTDRGVLVLRTRNWWPYLPAGGEPLARLPRETRFGELDGVLWGRVTVADSPLRIARRFHADVAKADRERHHFRASRASKKMAVADPAPDEAHGRPAPGPPTPDTAEPA